MAIIKSAKKEIKSSAKRGVFNLRRVRAMKASIKDFRLSVKNGNEAEAKEKFIVAQKAIDNASKRGVIKKNNGSRKKSRLMISAKKAFAK